MYIYTHIKPQVYMFNYCRNSGTIKRFLAISQRPVLRLYIAPAVKPSRVLQPICFRSPNDACSHVSPSVPLCVESLALSDF